MNSQSVHRIRRATLVLVTAVAVAAPAVGILSKSAAAASVTRPSAPIGLTVDDQPRPMNTDESPRFGWLPQDDDANEVQTSYKIEVRDDEGSVVWDSDKVKSAQQSHVEY